MKFNRRLTLGLFVLLLLCALAWWLKTAKITALKDGGNPSASDAATQTKPTTQTLVSPIQTVSNTVRNGSAPPKRKYSEMGNEEGRAVIEEIEKKDMEAILQHFLDADRIEHDGMKRMVILDILSAELRNRKPNMAFLKTLREFIESGAPTKFDQDMMLGVLARASTKEPGELLLHLAATLRNKDTRKSAIRSVGNLVRDEADETLAPALNRAWIETTESDLMESAAKAMGRTGAPSSVELLLTAALLPDGKDDERREAAMSGLATVWTENAVPPLAALLEKSPVGSKAGDLAFGVLLNTTGKEGPQAVLKWLQNADNTAAPMAKMWFENIRNADTQVKPMEAALDPKIPFRSEENRKAIRECLEAYRAGRASR